MTSSTAGNRRYQGSDDRILARSEFATRLPTSVVQNHDPIPAPGNDEEVSPFVFDGFPVEATSITTDDTRRDGSARRPTSKAGISRKEQFHEMVNKYWLWESSACILSILCLASIVGVLSYEDGKQLDQWGWSIPPTAVVSFIGTMAKGSLVLILSQTFSQMKWLCFQEFKSLNNLRTLDAASRGPLGSLEALFSKKILVSIAAVLSITTILVDPFFQLVFSFPSQLVEDQTQLATMERLLTWNGSDDKDSEKYDLWPKKIWSSINRGLASEDLPLALNCPSGNCTWSDSINTLAICGSCTDLTAATNFNCTKEEIPRPLDQHSETELTCMYSLKNNSQRLCRTDLATKLWTTWEQPRNSSSIPLNGGLRSWVSTSPCGSTYKQADENLLDNSIALEFNGSPISFPGSAYFGSNSLLSYQVLQHFPMTHMEQKQSIEELRMVGPGKYWTCELYWCEKTFEDVSVINGQAPTYKSSTRRLLNLFSENSSTIYAVSQEKAKRFANDVWRMDYSYARNGFTSIDRSPALLGIISYCNNRARSNGSDRYAGTGFDLEGNAAIVGGLVYSPDLNLSMHKIAESISEAFRVGNGSETVVGKALVTKSFIHVRWAWLALPLGLLVMTSILLVTVAAESRRKGIAVWKDDPVALLVHRIELNEVPTGPAGLRTMTDRVAVKLENDTMMFRRDQM